MLTGIMQGNHITPVLASWHRLSVFYEIQFKVLLFVFKAFNHFSPTFVSDLLSVLYSQGSEVFRSVTAGCSTISTEGYG